MVDGISEKDLADLKIEENDEESTNYKAPAKKTINELNDLDAEDESLRKYKEVRFIITRDPLTETGRSRIKIGPQYLWRSMNSWLLPPTLVNSSSKALLGSGGAGGGDAKRVVVKKIELHSDDLKQPLIMDLTLAPEKIKEQTFKVKEGAEYQLHFFFQVNNEILSGLRYSQVNWQSFSYENELK